ncbi:LPS O-antigen chain length determinant protein WzzB [Pseudomonas sp. B22(2017)]|uniref:LPS O-antigen chain length determinant protein WzzB n=1 Tax=Pseudomonas sp. B22(2017) TaxID=1981736 RepID=UPI000A1F41BE|nr:Wzz/FepE/Etk N-terminal domain-containing protein [Pseudomonas sp. B22(2017)]
MRNDRGRLVQEREFDIFDLLEGVWRQRWLVLAVTVVLTALFAIYAMVITPIYQAKVLLQAPLESDINQLNFGRGGVGLLAPISAKEVNDDYKRNLQSDALRQLFYQRVYLPSLREDLREKPPVGLYAKFSSQFIVVVSEPDARASVTVLAEDPQLAADWAVRYAELAGEQTKKELAERVASDFKVEAANIQQSIDAARASAKLERQDRIAQLVEALKIAKSIDLEKPPIISSTLTGEVSAGMTGSLMYMRGSKALESEIQNLQTRSSDDPFVDGLREREEKVSFYRTFNKVSGEFAVYRQDGVVETPDRPIKPRKVLLVILGVLFGLFAGLFIALVREAWHYRQARTLN